MVEVDPEKARVVLQLVKLLLLMLNLKPKFVVKS